MNKLAKITIGILSVLMLFFVIMAQIQRVEAEKQKIAALEYAEMALKGQQEAEKQAELAQLNAAKVVAIQNEIEKNLKELHKCQNSQ